MYFVISLSLSLYIVSFSLSIILLLSTRFCITYSDKEFVNDLNKVINDFKRESQDSIDMVKKNYVTIFFYDKMCLKN